MERVLYFSGYRMTVFDWENKTLIGRRSFEPDENGFKQFERMLAASIDLPVRLLVDMIEEDFRREVIPHVNPLDRRALVKRLVDRHFREEDFVHTQMIGRVKGGRKDDQILLSALTNTGLLSPWIGRIEEFNVQLCGIWSLPLLTERLLRPLHQSDEHSLVVSRQVRSALRISYFQRRSLILSRQTRFDKEMWDRDDFEGVILNLGRGTEEIHNFLLNHRIMTTAEPLKVYCILEGSQLSSARQLIEDHSNIHYEFVSIESLFSHFGLSGCENAKADTLFAYLSSRKNPFNDHYGTDELKQPYYRYLANKVVKQVAELGALACITAAVFLALNALELDLRRDRLVEETTQLVTEHNQRFGHLMNQLETAPYVRDTVQLHDQLVLEAAESPHQYFGRLSRVFAEPRFSVVQLTQMEWEKRTSADVSIIVSDYRNQIESLGADRTIPDEYYEQYSEEPEVAAPERQPVLTLVGSVDTKGLSYRRVSTIMNELVNELERVDGIESVLLLRTAVDVRESSQFSDQIGEENSGSPQPSDAGEFEIMIVMEPISRA